MALTPNWHIQRLKLNKLDKLVNCKIWVNIVLLTTHFKTLVLATQSLVFLFVGDMFTPKTTRIGNNYFSIRSNSTIRKTQLDFKITIIPYIGRSYDLNEKRWMCVGNVSNTFTNTNKCHFITCCSSGKNP